jgi:hypothetical protein
MQAAADDGVSSSDEDADWELEDKEQLERAGRVSGELPRCWIYRQQRRLRLRLGFQFRRW